jgi:hypothetical protein
MICRRFFCARRVVQTAIVIAAVLCVAATVCAYVPFYAGATYSDSAGGYKDTGGPSGQFPFGIDQSVTVGTRSGMVSAVNDAGMAISLATLNYNAADGGASEGLRAMRLTPSGVVEMDNLERGAPDFNGAAALDINASGVAVGQAYTYVASSPSFPKDHALFDSRPVRWNAAGTVATELASFSVDSEGRAFGAAYGVNSAGTAVGFSLESQGTWSAARWDAGGTAVRRLIGGSFAVAYAINDPGVAVGYSSILINGNNGGNRPVRWDPANVDGNNNVNPTILSPEGVNENNVGNAYVWDINNSGTAIGTSLAYDSLHRYYGMRAVRWDAGATTPTELDILAPYPPDLVSSNNFAYKINAGGTIVGIAEKYDNAGNSLGIRPARWAAGGHTVTELGLLGTDATGHAEGVANDINDSGVAVGEVRNYNSAGNPQVAVYWGPNGAAVDLNSLIDPSLGWQLVEARHISNTGWITGWGHYFPNGPGTFTSYNRAFLIHLPLDGDFNFDSKVDAADYVALRKQYPDISSGAGLTAYQTWRSNFGQTAGNGSGAVANATVPEPVSLVLLMFATAACNLRRVRVV